MSQHRLSRPSHPRRVAAQNPIHATTSKENNNPASFDTKICSYPVSEERWPILGGLLDRGESHNDVIVHRQENPRRRLFVAVVSLELHDVMKANDRLAEVHGVIRNESSNMTPEEAGEAIRRALSQMDQVDSLPTNTEPRRH